MYEVMPNRKLQWVRAMPGHIPDQAVIFGNNTHGDAMFVVRVNDGSITAGSFVSGKSCAEYLQYDTQAKCIPTFDFLVLKRGEPNIITHVTVLVFYPSLDIARRALQMPTGQCTRIWQTHVKHCNKNGTCWWPNNFYPAALKGSGVLSSSKRADQWTARQTSPIDTLTSVIYHGSSSSLARTFIALRSRTSSIMEVLPH